MRQGIRDNASPIQEVHPVYKRAAHVRRIGVLAFELGAPGELWVILPKGIADKGFGRYLVSG